MSMKRRTPKTPELVDFRLPDGRTIHVETKYSTSLIKEADSNGTLQLVDLADSNEVCKHLRRAYGTPAVTAYRTAKVVIQIMEEGSNV